MLLMEHFESFTQKVQTCINEVINTNKTFNEAGTPVSKAISGSQVFGGLTTVLYQYVCKVDGGAPI